MDYSIRCPSITLSTCSCQPSSAQACSPPWSVLAAAPSTSTRSPSSTRSPPSTRSPSRTSCVMAPLCNICSYRQRGERQGPVYHQHNSPREVRILQGVEYSDSNPTYMCPTCVVMHPAKPDIGLNVCLSDSMLHNFHQPRDPTVICPPDPFHVDWVTIPGGTIQDLTQAFIVDY